MTYLHNNKDLFNDAILAAAEYFHISPATNKMEQKKFEAMLVLIVPKVIGLITEKNDMDEINATRSFYASQVYELLEQEDTKLWHLSPLTLFNMYDEEIKTGKITFPEE